MKIKYKKEIKDKTNFERIKQHPIPLTSNKKKPMNFLNGILLLTTLSIQKKTLS